VADWHRGLFSGGLAQGFVQWRTGTGVCSVADWHRVLFSDGLEHGLVQCRTGTRSSVANEQGLVPSRIYFIVNPSCSAAVCTVTQHCYLSSDTVASRKHSRLYPKLVVCSGRDNLLRSADDTCRKDKHTEGPPLIISQRSIMCCCLITNT